MSKRTQFAVSRCIGDDYEDFYEKRFNRFIS